MDKEVKEKVILEVRLMLKSELDGMDLFYSVLLVDGMFEVFIDLIIEFIFLVCVDLMEI